MGLILSCCVVGLQDLIERWSRPIFDQHRERREDEDLRERELQMRQARAARLHAQEAAAAENDGDGSRKVQGLPLMSLPIE